MNNAARNIHPINAEAPLWDFGTDLNKVEETAASFIQHVNYATGWEPETMTGLALMLKSIQGQKNPLNVYDFCDKILAEIFRQTREFDMAQRVWETSILEGKDLRDGK